MHHTNAARELEQENLAIGVFPVDVTNPRTVERFVTEVVARSSKLDRLVNSAGIGGLAGHALKAPLRSGTQC